MTRRAKIPLSLLALTAGAFGIGVTEFVILGLLCSDDRDCAVAPTYGPMMTARILTAFAHGTFFGVGSVVATRLVAPDRRASAIAIMFTGLTVANVLGVSGFGEGRQ
jgi:DHA1 family inner membrane transport protein